MGHLLPDGRILMASYEDIHNFFETNRIIGRKIVDIRPAAYDYMIRNLSDFDDLASFSVSSAIDTDKQICIIFADGDTLEIEFCGDGPIILGFNSADLSQYPVADGSCYTLRTLFKHSLRRTITNVDFERTKEKMLFPSYRNIDMSADDDGIKSIRFTLDDDSSLISFGSIDYFQFWHQSKHGEEMQVPLSELLAELSQETLSNIFE